MSDDAENAIAVAPGANAGLAPGDLPDLSGVGWLVMQLETPLPTVVAYARAATAAGVAVLLNAAPARALPAELLAAVDLLVVNEEELTAIAGAGGSVAERLARTGARAAVATLGARGCCAVTAGNTIEQPTFPVTPVDTTAAGDTFCGALAAALARGEALHAALAEAAAAGALATTRAGAQTSIPDRADVLRLMARGPDPANR